MCYSEECSDKGGLNEGSCASGFGVCCVRKLNHLLIIACLKCTYILLNYYFQLLLVVEEHLVKITPILFRQPLQLLPLLPALLATTKFVRVPLIFAGYVMILQLMFLLIQQLEQ